MTTPSPTPASSTPSSPSATNPRGAMLALAAALLGWMFDGFEMGLFSQVGRSAVQDLLGFPETGTLSAEQGAAIGLWFGVIIALFLVGAATGGVLFGWLGDRIGRVRAMSLSVLTYALFTGLCGIAQDRYQIGFLRFIASLGMGGEWSLGVALVMEVWPNRSRAFMAGLIGAAANAGYLLVALIGMGLVGMLEQAKPLLEGLGFSTDTVNWLTRFQGWRLMMIIGALPALLTFFIRMFVPESHKWEEEKRQGSTSHWSSVDLLGVLVGAIGPAMIIGVWLWTPKSDAGSAPKWLLPLQIVATILGVVIAAIGYLWPARGFLRRSVQSGQMTPLDQQQTLRRMLLGACLSGVALLATWGSAQWAPGWAEQLAKAENLPVKAKEWTQFWLAAGAMVGTILAALACDQMGRRMTYRLICVLSMVSLVWLYLGNLQFDNGFLLAAFFVGVCTAAFYGWLPLYLPELFRTSVRATGQGFGFNFGRILAAIGAVQTGTLIGFFKTNVNIPWLSEKPIPAWPVACSMMSAAYLVGLVVICFAPETKGKPLPD